MELMERKTAGFSAAMDVLNGKFAKIGKWFADKDKGPIMWGNFLKGWDIKALERAGDEMNAAAIKAEELRGRLQDLEEEEIRFQV
jgi:hypothetical protein